MDIFETLKSMVGCMYISDLRFGDYKTLALELIHNLEFEPEQKTQAFNYLGV